MEKAEPKYTMGLTSILQFDFINMLTAKSSSSYISESLKLAVHLLAWLANSLELRTKASDNRLHVTEMQCGITLVIVMRL